MSEKKTQVIEPLAQSILSFVEASEQAKQKRMDQNKENFEFYNLQQDFSHKKRGQSKEFLGKQQMATEQITSFLQQGLIDMKDWFAVEFEKASEDKVITADVLFKLLDRQLSKADIMTFFSDSLKMGLLGSLMICKVHGHKKNYSKFEVEDKIGPNGLPDGKRLFRVNNEYWELKLDLVRQEDYYPDYTGDGLCETQAIDIDWFSLMDLARQYPDVYDIDVIRELGDSQDSEQERLKARETNQDQPLSSGRKRIRIFEAWGTILHPQTNEPIVRNGVAAITSDGRVIRQPKENPLWHNESPFVTAPIIRVPKSVWHRALMDSPTKHNKALNELYNLHVDGGVMEVFGIKQIREDWLEDPSEVSDGVHPGQTIGINSKAPVGAKAIETVSTGSLSSSGFNMYNLVDREFQASSLTNDSRMGNLAQRAVKATEIVAANQTITGIFNGIVKMIEIKYVMEIIRKSALVMAQNMNDLHAGDVKALLGPELATLLATMSPEERFAKIANGARFKVYGLSTLMNRINDFRKITTLLQTIGADQTLITEFRKKYSMPRLLGEIIKSLEINEEKIRLSPEEEAQVKQEMQQQMQMAMMMAQAGGGKKGMTQVPNAGDLSERNGSDELQSSIQTGLSSGEA